jgi:alpha-L-arabinofuranosidase
MAKRMQTMVEVESLKHSIARTWRDAEMASSACYGLEAYAKRWPFVLRIDEWDVWDEGRKDLKPEVSGWLNQQGALWDFYHLLGSFGLIGFKDSKAATLFKLRWSGVLTAVTSPRESSSGESWNPHPLNSSFAPHPHDEPMVQARRARHAGR